MEDPGPFPEAGALAARQDDAMDRLKRNDRRSVRFQPWNDRLEERQLLSGGTWPPYVSRAELFALLHEPIGYPPVPPNPPALPYGAPTKLAAYVDPTAHIINGYAAIV